MTELPTPSLAPSHRTARRRHAEERRRFAGAPHSLLVIAFSISMAGCTGIFHEQRFVPDVERGEASVVERRDYLRRMAGGVVRLSGRTGALVLDVDDVRLGIATERVRSGVYAFGPLLPFIPFPVNDEARDTLAVLLQLESDTTVAIRPDATRIRLDDASRWNHAVATSNGFQFDRDVTPILDDETAIPIAAGERLWLHFDIDPRDPEGFTMELAFDVEERPSARRVVPLRFTKNRATFFVVLG